MQVQQSRNKSLTTPSQRTSPCATATYSSRPLAELLDPAIRITGLQQLGVALSSFMGSAPSRREMEQWIFNPVSHGALLALSACSPRPV
jgi:hypothetical protein